MGLANLVPGISGGTMLLVSGIYPQFIESLANITRLKLRFRSLLILGCVVAAGGIGILLFAGTLKELVVNQRWIMYSLFVGLTLGGLPIVWKLARPVTPSLIVGAIVSFGAMAGLAALKANGIVGFGNSNVLILFFAGTAGASAMILPGLSGGYLLLLMGQYVPILNAIDQFKEALAAREVRAAIEPAVEVLLPVGLGVVAGVVLVGNLLQWLLRRHRKATLGVLLGLLLGSVVGLWPFQVGVQPKLGEVVNGEVVTQENLTDIDEKDWPLEVFRPSAGQAVSSVLLIGIGIGATIGVSMIGRTSNDRSENAL